MCRPRHQETRYSQHMHHDPSRYITQEVNDEKRPDTFFFVVCLCHYLLEALQFNVMKGLPQKERTFQFGHYCQLDPQTSIWLSFEEVSRRYISASK